MKKLKIVIVIFKSTYQLNFCCGLIRTYDLVAMFVLSQHNMVPFQPANLIKTMINIISKQQKKLKTSVDCKKNHEK